MNFANRHTDKNHLSPSSSKNLYLKLKFMNPTTQRSKLLLLSKFQRINFANRHTDKNHLSPSSSKNLYLKLKFMNPKTQRSQETVNEHDPYE